MNPSDIKVTAAAVMPKRRVVRKVGSEWASFFAVRKAGDLINVATVAQAKIIQYHARKAGFVASRRPNGDGQSVYLKSGPNAPEPTEAPAQASGSGPIGTGVFPETPAPVPVPEAPMPEAKPKVWLPLSVTATEYTSDALAKKYAEDAYNIYHHGTHGQHGHTPWKVVMGLNGYEDTRTRWLNIGAYIAAMVQGGAK